MHRMVRIHLFRYRDRLPDETFFNNDCLFYKQFKHSNRTDFQNDGTCEYCSALEYDTPCLARRIQRLVTIKKLQLTIVPITTEL